MHTTMGRRRSRLLAILSGLLLMVIAGVPAAHACDCMGYDFEEAVEAADLIADVTIEDEISDDSGEVTYFAVVETVWKGEESRTIEFTTHEQTASCGLGRIEAGTSLLVWASGADGSYSSTWCALPMDGGPEDRERLTGMLGEPADLTGRPVPEAGEPGGPPEQSVPVWAVSAVVIAGLGLFVAMVMAAVIVVAWRIGKRRRT